MALPRRCLPAHSLSALSSDDFSVQGGGTGLFCWVYFAKDIKVSVSSSLQLQMYFLHGKEEILQLVRAGSVSLEVMSSPWWET